MRKAVIHLRLARRAKRCIAHSALWVAALGALLVATTSVQVHASNPSDFVSEIITPAGWELQTASGRCSWSGDLSTSVEIITPDGWLDARREQPRWGGSVCSELVVPPDWMPQSHASHASDWR